MTDREDTKYGEQIKDHDWSKPDEGTESRRNTNVAGHELEITHIYDETKDRNYGKHKYRIPIRYDDETGNPYALYAVKHRWKGNYWRDTTDFDWRDLPKPVKRRVASLLPVESHEVLRTEERLIPEGGESRWQKYHKDKVDQMEAGEMWGSSFLGDALIYAKKAAEAVREQRGDVEPVESAIEEIQRAYTVLNETEGDNR